MAGAFEVLAMSQCATGARVESLETLVRAIRLLRPRYDEAPTVWLPTLLPLCTRYVELCGVAGVPFDLPLVGPVIERAMAAASEG
jgi:hypothetical protein